MYALQSKGIPLAVPVNEKQVVKAMNNNSKLSVPLYTRLGEDIGKMKKDIKQYVSRNVIQGKSWSEIADGLANGMNTPFGHAYNLATRIARTEGHKIQEQARFDSLLEAKDAGADVVKQWDATLDDRTREEHAEADGQIREFDEPFDVGGEQIMMPGEGSAENCINCRCTMLIRPRWALDESELAELQDRASYFGLDKTKDFNEYMEKYLNLPVDMSAPVSMAAQVSQARQTLAATNVGYNDVKPLKKPLTTNQIIQRVGGGDQTSGSCSSLGFTYIGNKNGLDVLDFRGGYSQRVFAQNRTIVEIAQLPKVESNIVLEYNDYKAVKELLKNVESGKEYYLATGKHASIIRKTKTGFEYLELQSATSNGFKTLTNDVLKRRFGCQKSHTVAGNKVQMSNVLIESSSLKGNKEFEQLLGYINTAAKDQQKGITGNVK